MTPTAKIAKDVYEGSKNEGQDFLNHFLRKEYFSIRRVLLSVWWTGFNVFIPAIDLLSNELGIELILAHMSV